MGRNKRHNQLRLDFDQGGTWMKLPAEAREGCTKLLSQLLRAVIAAEAKERRATDEQRQDPRITS